jgi:hypothetical protein
MRSLTSALLAGLLARTPQAMNSPIDLPAA